jgi:hypothetical protein
MVLCVLAWCVCVCELSCVVLLAQARGISIKAMPMSLVLEGGSGKSFLVNLIDCPGHVNFNDEVGGMLQQQGKMKLPRNEIWIAGRSSALLLHWQEAAGALQAALLPQVSACQSGPR